MFTLGEAHKKRIDRYNEYQDLELENKRTSIDYTKAQTEEMRSLKKEREAELRRKGYGPNNEIIAGSQADLQQKQINLSLEQAKAQQARLDAIESDAGYTEYSETGDANALWKRISNNPRLKDAYASQGVKAIANINYDDPNDQAMLKRKGFTEFEYDTKEKRDIINKSMYKQFDGKKWEPSLVQIDIAENGYARRNGKTQVDMVNNNAKEFKNLLAGPKTSGNTAEGHKYENAINKASKETKVPANLIASVMNTEKGKIQSEEDIANNTRKLAQYLKLTGGDTRQALTMFADAESETPDGEPSFEARKFVFQAMENYEKGESYYQVGEDYSRGNAQLGAGQQTTQRMDRTAQSKLEMINAFARNEALAKAGVTPEQKQSEFDTVQMKATADLMKAKAALSGEDKKTTLQKNQDAGNAKLEALKAETEGVDFTDGENYNKVMPKLLEVESLLDAKPDADTLKRISDYRKIAKQASEVSKTKVEDIGWINDTWNNVSERYTKDVDRQVKRQAFMQIRNLLRYALFGGALNEGEIEAFDQSMAQLGDAKEAVLGSFKTMLMSLTTDLRDIETRMLPTSAKIRLARENVALEGMNERVNNLINSFTDTVTTENIEEGDIKPFGTEKEEPVNKINDKAKSFLR